MKWIKLFENFDYNSFDLYTDLTMIQFRKLANERQRFKPTESDLFQGEFKCEFCDKKMRKASIDNLKGLTWLWPDEKWICPNCLRYKRLDS